jgi:hypothetical protein
MQVFDGLPEQAWDQPGVTTRWTPRQVLAHLASYELMLGDAIESVLDRGSRTTLDQMLANHAAFNEAQVERRRDDLPDQILREYADAHERVMELASELGGDRLREAGTIPWYGEAYSLDDLIVYANYAHKREHCGQVRQFRLRHGF